MGSSVPTSHPTGRLGETAFPGTQAAEGKQYRQREEAVDGCRLPKRSFLWALVAFILMFLGCPRRNINSGQSVDEMKNVSVQTVTVVTTTWRTLPAGNLDSLGVFKDDDVNIITDIPYLASINRKTAYLFHSSENPCVRDFTDFIFFLRATLESLHRYFPSVGENSDRFSRGRRGRDGIQSGHDCMILIASWIPPPHLEL